MNKIKKILKAIFWIILIFIAIYSTIIIFQKIIWKNKTPNFLGYKNFIVLTGSMEPTLNIGDIVFVKETTDIKEQDIVSFKINNAVVTHRIVEIKKEDDKTLYITKGDANSGNDTEILSIEDIEGKYSFKISYLGNVILFFQKPIGIISLFLIFAVILVITSVKSEKNPKHMKRK